MTLQEQIEVKLRDAIKARQDTRFLKILVGEMQRNVDKKLEDCKVLLLLKRLVDSEKENLEAQKLITSDYLSFLESFMPSKATDEEIVSWIQENIDFSGYSNKFATMKAIMVYFGVRAEGKNVKKIITEKF